MKLMLPTNGSRFLLQVINFRPAFIHPSAPRTNPLFAERIADRLAPVFYCLYPSGIIGTEHLAQVCTTNDKPLCTSTPPPLPTPTHPPTCCAAPHLGLPTPASSPSCTVSQMPCSRLTGQKSDIVRINDNPLGPGEQDVQC